MPVSVLTLDDFPGCPETEEDGETFEANAVKKAVEVARYTGKPALADDSGLEVYALGGAPGVFSARYSGDKAKDIENWRNFSARCGFMEKEERGARFVCCIAFAIPEGKYTDIYGHVRRYYREKAERSERFWL